MIDIKLTKGSDNLYDINFDDSGDFELDDSFETAITLSLLQNKRADESEHIVPQLRGGWWGNELNDVDGYQIGSKIWLLFQAKSTQENFNLCRDYALDSLNWFLEDGYLKDVQVNILDDFTVNVVFVRNSNEVSELFYNLWENY